MKLNILFVLVLTSFFACGDKKVASHPVDKNQTLNHVHQTDHNPSNVSMNQSSFDDLARAFENPERDVWQKPNLVIELMGDLTGKKVGDIGAGTGYFSFRIAQKAETVIGIDVDERFIRYMQKERVKDKVNNFSTRLVGYEDPNLGSEEFDILLTVNTYHHFNDKVAYMTKCKDGLAEEGKLFIIDFKKIDLPVGPPVNHKLNPNKVKEDLLKAGFKTISIDTSSLSYQYIITAKKE